MTTTEIESPPEVEAATEPVAARRARIDGPHPAIQQPPLVVDDSPLEIEQPAAALLAAIVGQSPEARREQIELQAAQLGDHLRERLREVDRREAHLNARMAQVEADLRASRICLGEREHEFQEREAELLRQLTDLQTGGRRAADGQAEQADCETSRQQLAEREHQLQLKENELRERRFETDRQTAALRHAQQLWQQERSRQEAELARERERLAAEFGRQSAERDERLAASEAQVAEQARQLEREVAELAADRQAWEERRRTQAAALDERDQHTAAQLDDRRGRLDARDEWIQQQKAGLEQVREEVVTLHRQSLEMRLLAEQLWSQIGGRLTPTELTQSIAGLRLKLAEHYRLEEQGLTERKGELLELGQRVAAEHRELVQLREGLKAWLAARQGEIESQAASLVQRELQLDGQQESLASERRAWQTQRRAFERQIAELTDQLREPAAA